ncbi:MAG: hypothetical protein KBD52_02085 [Candidatus Pacebacteria bacterium]|nr:hypothetical protein [Candidatus Paceibacterota bacterium]
MDTESKELLEKTFALTEENNKMLKKIRSAQKWASFARSVYWVIVIGLGIGAFYFIQPYFEKTQNFFQNTSDTVNSFKNTFSN